jgi:hypothetical protein
MKIQWYVLKASDSTSGLLDDSQCVFLPRIKQVWCIYSSYDLDLSATESTVVQNLSFHITGACFNLFMMKSTARILAAEGYNGGRTQAPGLVIRMFRFCSPDLPHLLLCKQDSNG